MAYLFNPLDGSPDQLMTATLPGFPAGDFSTLLVFRRDRTSVGTSEMLLNDGNFASSGSRGFRIVSNNVIQCAFLDSDNNGYTLDAPANDSGIWHVFIVTFDYDTLTARAYLDGELADQETIAAWNGIGNDEWTIGNQSNLPFAGAIADWGYWSRVLTEQEIADLSDFESGVRARDLTNGLLALYEMDGLTDWQGANAMTVVTGSPTLVDGPYSSTQPELTPIEDLTVQEDDGAIVLAWTPPVGATAQQIHRSLTSPVPEDGSAALGAPLAGSADQAMDTDVVNGTTYYYKISATDGVTVVWSNEVNGTPRQFFGRKHAASQWQVQVSGGNWSNLVWDSGLDTVNLTSITIPEETLTPNTTYQVRVRHKDDSTNPNTEWSEWSAPVAFTTASTNTPPVVTITKPAGNITISEGVEIVLAGSATDTEDGPLLGEDLVWTSNVDGVLGTGNEISVTLSGSNNNPVVHVITLTATDSNDATGSDSVVVTVGIGGGSGVTRTRRQRVMATMYQYDPISSRRRVPLFLEDVSGNPVTGESGRPQISKNLSAFVNTTNSLVEVGNGHYYVELTQNELDTLGTITVRYRSGNTIECMTLCDVVPLMVVSAGSVSSATNARNLTLPTGQSIRPGNMIQITNGTGAGGAAIVQSYTSGTGATVLEAPGLPVQPDGSSRYVVYAAPQAGLVVDGNGRVDVGSIAGTQVSGPNDLKADVSGLSTFNPATTPVTVSGVNNSVIDAFWSRTRAAVNPPAGSFGAYLDAAISSISGGGSGEGPSAEAIADAVWRELLSDHQGQAGSVAAVIATLLAYIDELRSRLTASRASALDNLDVAVSSRLAASNYTAPDNARIAAIEVDTQDIQSRLPAALVNGRIDANLGAIGGDTAAVTKFLRSVSGIIVFTVGSNSTASTIRTNLTNVDDFHNQSLMVMVTGALAGQKRTVQDFQNTNGVLIPDTPFTSAPAPGDIGVLV